MKPGFQFYPVGELIMKELYQGPVFVKIDLGKGIPLQYVRIQNVPLNDQTLRKIVDMFGAVSASYVYL